ncbi:hypothetical protein Ae263Ps1_5132 [Pseudonocardia sp. Ae263_Ps1]|nr:hypothetical protein Ae150APs1_0209c [Pseudonocardia sp. Ae150A_Ps1]OLL88077.1 hypothetical protein Ae263Ps1_5132 [Pseudonocardia sp. Ae263_Ps1]OLL91897.1 hypothetical protein Ae356Ps1_1794c [Pseudonocardia sp. Ae356_Ps1]
MQLLPRVRVDPLEPGPQLLVGAADVAQGTAEPDEYLDDGAGRGAVLAVHGDDRGGIATRGEPAGTPASGKMPPRLSVPRAHG